MIKKKEIPKKKKRGEYDKPLKVEGSFLDIMKASVKNANDNSAPKKEDKMRDVIQREIYLPIIKNESKADLVLRIKATLNEDEEFNEIIDTYVLDSKFSMGDEPLQHLKSDNMKINFEFFIKEDK